MHIGQFDHVYFIGVGGIGMSALARYFCHQGMTVGGYDKTPSELTATLESEGVAVHYDDLGANLPEEFLDVSKTLVVYTPAIPKEMEELLFVREAGYTVLKRAEVLGLITRNSKAIGVAGTHGKTTTSTMLAHLLNESALGCNAFLGGIATNFNSNFVSHPTSEWTVIEADEFDRSFLQLDPYASIITSTDADHLDIYGDNDTFLEGFRSYAGLVAEDGFLVQHNNVELAQDGRQIYGLDTDTAYSLHNLRFKEGRFLFDVNSPEGEMNEVELGIPGIHNAENALACIAVGQNLGIPEEVIRSAMKSFKGVKRRFEYHVRKEELVYIDDYAHHPTEIKALIDSVRLLYPEKKIIGAFQPHLYSRTRDFFDGFAEELSQLDELVLLPIYPARELPIEGVTSEALLEKIDVDKKLMTRDNATTYLSELKEGVVLTIGAGDIDRMIPELKERLQNG